MERRCFTAFSCIKEGCQITVVSYRSKNTQHIHSVLCPVKAGVMDCLSSGNKLLTPSPDPFPVWRCVCSRGEIESVCPLLLQGVFPNAPPPLSLSVQSCSRWGDRAQHAATGSPGNLCPPSKNMFWPSVPHLEGYLLLKPFFSAATWHNTLDRFYFDTLKEQNIFTQMKPKNQRSCVAIVSRILLREVLALA